MLPSNQILKEMALGQEGIRYVASCLREGAGLCSKLLETSFENGRAFAPLPEGVSLERAKKFNTGGLTSRHKTTIWLVGYVRKLRQGSLIFQDVWAKPTDRGVKTSDLQVFFQNENAYYFLDRADANLQSVMDVMRAITSYLFVAMYVEHDLAPTALSDDRTVDEEIIEKIAWDTTQIFVGAYDLEGLVVWSR